MKIYEVWIEEAGPSFHKSGTYSSMRSALDAIKWSLTKGLLGKFEFKRVNKVTWQSALNDHDLIKIYEREVA